MIHKTARAAALATAVWLGTLASASAQSPPAPTPNDTLVSPRVAADGRVTLQIYAPRAGQVGVIGDWMISRQPLPFEKDDRGVWSLEVGPLPADFYSYTLIVDGVRTLDPKNPMIKQGNTSVDNMFLVPGAAIAYADNQPVAHGTLREVWYASQTLGTQRRMHVYTPPGYDGGRTTYPVLYLLHGGGDEDSGWSTIGRAGFIIDNLLASHDAVPMLVVMPNGSLPAAGPPGVPATGLPFAETQKRFERELMSDIVPYMEKNYRVRANRDGRAIAGLSMGGLFTMQVFASNPDAFRYVAIWSAGLFNQDPAAYETENAAFLASARTINRDVKLLAIAAGSEDFALPGTRKLVDVLNAHGITNEVRISGGGHTWLNWRSYLHELVPKLFR